MSTYTRVSMIDARTREGRTTAASAPSRGMKLAAVGFGLVLACATLEVVLRVAPQAISPDLLVLFESGLREDIGAGRFPLEKDFRRIDRDDAGPPLFVARPESRIVSIDRPADGSERFADELGFCNPAGIYNRNERIDVIALGDSFTWCHAVRAELSWPSQLGLRVKVATFSLGLGGKGPYEYLQFLREFGLAKRPRVVIMNIYGGNDLRDAFLYDRHRSAIEAGIEPAGDQPRPIAPGLVASVAGRHSYALNFVLALASRLADPVEKDPERKGIDFHYTLDLASGRTPFNVENRDRDEVLFARALERGNATLTLWENALARFAALGVQHGFVPVVGYTPSAYAAYGPRVRFEDASLAPLLERFNRAQREFLASAAKRLNYVFLDLTPALAAAASQGDALLYDPDHMHLTARGHEVVADAFARLLAERALLQDGTPRAPLAGGPVAAASTP